MSEHTWPVVDQLPVDEHGLYIIPQGYPLWHEAWERNRERIGAILNGKVDAGPPQKYPIDLASGITTETDTESPVESDTENHFWKTHDNIVMLICRCTTSNNVSFGMHIGALPEGFHPSNTVTVVATLLTTDLKEVTAHIDIRANGLMTLWPSRDFGDLPARRIVFAASFLSDQ